MTTRVADAGAPEVVCPHCKKPFRGRLIAGEAARYQGFKCPHCRLFVPFERAAQPRPADAESPVQGIAAPLPMTRHVAIDVAVPQPRARARTRAVPARRACRRGSCSAAIVAASFALRVVASLGHLIPLYFPDEYLYSRSRARSPQSGRPLVRGGAAHFPALLEPLLAAPFWLARRSRRSPTG